MKFKIIVFLFFGLLIAGCSAFRNSFDEKNSSRENPPQNLKPVELPINPQEQEELLKLEKLYSEAVEFLKKGEITEAESTLVSALDIILSRGDDENRFVSEDYKKIETQITNEYKRLIKSNPVYNKEASPEAIRNEINKISSNETDVTENKTEELALSSFPLIINRKVGNVIRFFQTRGKKTFTRWLERSTVYRDMMKEIFKKEGIPEDLIYISMIESGFNPRAISSRYAVGMWQFMSSTGKKYGLRRNRFIDERKDPIKSTIAAAKHLKDLYKEYNDWYLTVASYNCSPKRIKRAIRRHKTKNFWKLRTLPRETRNFVPTLIGAILIAKNPEVYGFRNINYLPPLKVDMVRLKTPVDLAVAAECMNADYLELKKLNPELNSWLTPAFKDGYFLKIPAGKKDVFLKNFKKLSKNELVKYFPHRIKRGETISSISKKYKTTISEILSINKIRNVRRLRIGTIIKVPAHPSVRYTKRYVNKVVVPGRKKVVYKVKPGDTLGEIAEVYGVRARDIRYWNNLSYREYIYPEQRLNIWILPEKDYGNRSTTSEKSDVFIYKVKRGDSIAKISKYFSVSEKDIILWNNLTDKNVIFPGQSLKLYLKTGSVDKNTNRELLTGNFVKYVVRKGDSLWKISRIFGISLNRLIEINNLRGRKLIHPGDQLIIPEF